MKFRTARVWRVCKITFNFNGFTKRPYFPGERKQAVKRKQRSEILLFWLHTMAHAIQSHETNLKANMHLTATVYHMHVYWLYKQ